MASNAKAGPLPPRSAPPAIPVLSMCANELPSLRARQAQLQNRLLMQRDLLSRTEAELQEVTTKIAGRERQEEQALARIRAADAREAERERAARAAQHFSPSGTEADFGIKVLTSADPALPVWPRWAKQKKG